MSSIERDYYTIAAIQALPDATQRELADYLNMSLGKMNYCLKDLEAKGWVSLDAVQRNDGKWAKSYTLTSQGLVQKQDLIAQFITLKKADLKKIQSEIDLAELLI
jgi:DNA-binding PadR family transcriptional regulator